MKVTVDVGGHRKELEVVRRRDRAGGERMTISYDGQEADVRVVHRDGLHFVLEIEERHGDHVIRRRLRAAGYAQDEARQLWVNGSNVHYRYVPQGGRQETADDAAVTAAATVADLSASIPAVVSEILVAVGERVGAGQKLILLESMKMILPIQAPYDGVVSSIHCEEGDAVQPGVELIEIGK